MRYFVLAIAMLMPCSASVVSAQEIRLTSDEYFVHYMPDQSLIKLEEQLLFDPQSVDLLLDRAKLLMTYGRVAEARKDIAQASALNPYALYLHGFYGADGYLSIIENQPESALVELSLAQRMQFYREYIAEKQVNGTFSPLVTNTLLTVVFDIAGERMDLAGQRLRQFISEHEELAIGYDLLGVVLAETGRYVEAEDVLDDAIAVDPLYAMAWYNVGRIERFRGQYRHALDYFDAAISLRTELSKAYFDRALVYKEMSMYEQATTDLSFLIDKESALGQAAFQNRGLARKMSGDYAGAINDLSTAIEMHPDHSVLYKNRGNLNLLLARYEEAIGDFDRALSLDGDYAEAFYNRGLTFYIVGDKKAACADLDRSADLGLERANIKKQLLCESQW